MSQDYSECPVCSEPVEGGQELLDHMTEEHNAIQAMMDGRYPTP